MKKIILIFCFFFALTTLAQTGCISGNCTNGDGTFVIEKDEMYIGSFRNGSYNGYGVYINKNGDKYKGYFVNNNFNGEGEYFFKNGTSNKGTWQNNVLIKKSVETIAEKNKKIVASLSIPYDIPSSTNYNEVKPNKQAELELAANYKSSQNADKNFQKAALIYQKYADLGDVDCMMDLGFLYQFGDNTLSQDYTKALDLFKKAAEQNNNKAQAQIGFFNEYGYGIPVNNEEAIKWFSLAEANGCRGLTFKSTLYNHYLFPPEPEMVRCTRCDGFGTIYESHYEGGGTYTTGGDPVYGYAQTGTDRFGNTSITSSVAYKTPTQTYSNLGTEVKKLVTCPVCHGKRYLPKN